MSFELSRPLDESERAEIDAVIGRVQAAGQLCYASLSIRANGRIEHFLLGAHAGPSVVDWSKGEVAELFFAAEEGDEVIDRALLDFEDGTLVEIQRRDRILSRRGHPSWRVLAPTAESTLKPRTRRARQTSAKVELDPDQRRAVEIDRASSLLVLGEAGHGKTTVALHRMVRLQQEAKREGRSFRSLVLVPARGLAVWWREMLRELDAERVAVEVLDEWLVRRARAAFPDLPPDDSVDVKASIIRLKRHPALRSVLPEIAARSSKPARRSDLLHLFGDRALLAKVVDAAAGGLPRHAIEAVLEHTHLQFSRSSNEEFRHVTDKKRLRTLDGRDLDDGTPLEDAMTIDREDGAVLFEVDRLRRGPPRRASYDHIVLDEAQEIAPIELAVIRDAVAPSGTITVAGDREQQTDDTASFPGWDAALRELGRASAERVQLTESHRCPPAVTRFARGLVGRGPEVELVSSRALIASRFANDCHATAAMIDELHRFQEVDPEARIAIICSTEHEARRMQGNLRRGIASRLAVGRSLDFLPGVLVASVAEVKGLEFDVVVVPDASPSPPTEEGRRGLYVAVTRARHQVWLVAVQSEATPAEVLR